MVSPKDTFSPHLNTAMGVLFDLDYETVAVFFYLFFYESAVLTLI